MSHVYFRIQKFPHFKKAPFNLSGLKIESSAQESIRDSVVQLVRYYLDNFAFPYHNFFSRIIGIQFWDF